jgi:hypothetical protein
MDLKLDMGMYIDVGIMIQNNWISLYILIESWIILHFRASIFKGVKTHVKLGYKHQRLFTCWNIHFHSRCSFHHNNFISHVHSLKGPSHIVLNFYQDGNKRRKHILWHVSKKRFRLGEGGILNVYLIIVLIDLKDLDD